MILHKTPSAYIISHPEAIKESYKTFQLNPNLFEIHKPFITNVHKNLSEIALKLQDIYIKEIAPCYAVTPTKESDNSKAISAAKEFFTTTDYAYEKFHGANPTDTVVIANFKDREYIFPPQCKFFNCDLFGHEFGENESYDFVVLDPPWTNKFIKRRKGSCMGYDTHSNEQIEELKIKQILKPDAIIAIWSTNSKTERILSKFLGKWGLTYITTFYWLKVTTSGQITCPFTKEGGKQPFESLILAVNAVNGKTEYSLGSRIIVSTPSAINSHKPMLTQVLEDYFKCKFTSKCELFARYLSKEYVSYGNQVLKLNNSLLFNKN